MDFSLFSNSEFFSQIKVLSFSEMEDPSPGSYT